MDAFDLDAFAPRKITFKARGIEYCVSGDPDVDVVAQMLRIENTMGAADDVEASVSATQEGKELIVEMILDFDQTQDISKLKVGPQDVALIFALILHGSSVAAAVAQALTNPQAATDDETSAVATADGDLPDAAGDGDAAPLASASSSSGRSSLSAERDAGPPATGSA